MIRRILAAAILAAAFSVLVVPPTQAADVIPDGWAGRSFAHYGNPNRGEVWVETWVDLDWPCGPSDPCVIEAVRGHGRIEKLYRASRVQVDFVRLGIPPVDGGGVLTENSTNVNSGTAIAAESATRWLPLTDACSGDSFRVWSRTGFSVRWSDGTLGRNSLLGVPTFSYLCQVATMSEANRRQVRGAVLGR
jgi:hypothetical protein